MTGRAGNANPGPNKEPRVIGKGGEIDFAYVAIPAYRPIAGGLPGRGAKKWTCCRAINAVTDQIPHILSHGSAMPQIVIMSQKTGEERMIIGCGLCRRNFQKNKGV
jgi:hypothetical protein